MGLCSLTQNTYLRKTSPVFLYYFYCFLVNLFFHRCVTFVFQREFVQQLIDGVTKIIEMEKALEEGKSIDDLVAAIK